MILFQPLNFKKYLNKPLRIQKLENEIFFLNALPKSILIIPWIEDEVEEWIDWYNPHRIDIDRAKYYKFGLCLKP